jgi:hypothetical protein
VTIRSAFFGLLGGALVLGAVVGCAGTGDPSAMQFGPRTVYGWRLMTAEERDAYRMKMLAARSEEERERILEEHRAAMDLRASQRGGALRGGAGPGFGGGGF